MLVVYKHQNKKIKLNNSCTSHEIETHDRDINLAIITITGRYPAHPQRVINLVCKELVYVINGQGTVYVNNTPVPLETGDTILILPQEKYYWDGYVTLAIASTPAWTPDQHKIIA
jgi:mannose-6-phosphate isomerase-like protein (cupin superfamily)